MTARAALDQEDRSGDGIVTGGPGRVAARLLEVSAVIGVAEVALLIAMFAAFGLGVAPEDQPFGTINDALTAIVYLLLAPAVLVLGTALRAASPRLIAVATALGLVSIAAIVVLQVLLVRGDLTFAQQIGPVSVAFLVLGAWFVIVGRIGPRAGLRTGGVGLAILAAMYVGYPVWAIWMARQLRGMMASAMVGTGARSGPSERR
jgi:hypothetical protein